MTILKEEEGLRDRGEGGYNEERKGCERMYRIFIVEDDRTIAQAVAHLAENWGLVSAQISGPVVS